MFRYEEAVTNIKVIELLSTMKGGKSNELQPVAYKRYFRCNNCFLLLVYTIHLSLSTNLVDPPPMHTIYMKHPLPQPKERKKLDSGRTRGVCCIKCFVLASFIWSWSLKLKRRKETAKDNLFELNRK